MVIKKILKLNEYFNFGKRETVDLVKKINGVKHPLTFVKRLREEENCIGYTSLKEYVEKPNDKKDTEITVLQYENKRNNPKGYTEFKVSDKKKCYQKIVGYAPVGVCGQSEEFVAVVKVRLLPLILLPILLLGLMLCFVLIDANNNPDGPIDTIIEQWFPDIDENIGNKGEAEEKREVGQIYYNCFSKWHIKAGQTEDIAVPLTNDKKNNCYLTFEIFLEDTGEVLYKSKQVPPDTGIYQIDISRPLEKGEYTCKIHITSNELKTGASMNSYDMMVDLIVD